MAKIKKVGVLKMAGFMGLYGVATGLILGAFITLFSLIGISLSSNEAGLGMLGLGFIMGVGSIIFLPIMYGIMMFLMGLIFTPIMNLILRIIGGLEMDIEMQQQA